jgi:hypothetical protein
MVFEPDMGSGLGQYLDIDFIIVHDEHMSQCLLAGWSGVELLDPSVSSLVRLNMRASLYHTDPSLVSLDCFPFVSADTRARK